MYQVLEEIMQDYTYTVKKDGNKFKLYAEIYIKKLDETVTHNKEVISENMDLEGIVKTFRNELKEKVAAVLKNHKDEVLDDDKLIESLNKKIAALNEELGMTKKDLAVALQKITELELKLAAPSNPIYVPYPEDPPHVPWRTSPSIPDIPWDRYRIWCQSNTSDDDGMELKFD